jgi:hypothetical protein
VNVVDHIIRIIEINEIELDDTPEYHEGNNRQNDINR